MITRTNVGTSWIRRSTCHSSLSGRLICGRLDLVQVLQDGIELGLVTDEVEDGAPVSVLHVARHQVAGVVLEDLGAWENRPDCPGRAAGEGAGGPPLVRRDLPAAGNPD